MTFRAIHGAGRELIFLSAPRWAVLGILPMIADYYFMPAKFDISEAYEDMSFQ